MRLLFSYIIVLSCGAQYEAAYYHQQPYHHHDERHDEMMRWRRHQAAAAAVVEQHHHHQHHYGTTAAAFPAPPVMVATEQELAYMNHMQRSLALLKESVKKLSVGTGAGATKQKQQLSAAAAHAAVIEAVAAAGGSRVPVATLFKTIRKQRAQPRYHCCECGAASTTQWRNSPTGKKCVRPEICVCVACAHTLTCVCVSFARICNPCGMRLWRSRKRKEGAAAGSEEEQLQQEPKQEQQDQPSEEKISADAASNRGRSNIYNLLN